MPSAFLRHIERCTAHDPSRFFPLLIGGRALGAVRKDYAPYLKEIEGFALEEESVRLLPSSPEERTASLSRAADKLSALHGVPLVGEIYPVIDAFCETPQAQIDRAAIPWMGTRGFGVHVNGFVRKASGLHLWVARRAKDRRIDPGKLDNMIGGGLPLGFSVEENLCKEAWEEAGLPAVFARRATPAGQIRYKIDMMKGVRNDALFIFDLELPEDLAPRNTDGEVESFTLLPAREVMEIVAATDDFKFNCNLVMIDFFLRHGLLGEEKVKEAMEKIVFKG